MSPENLSDGIAIANEAREILEEFDSIDDLIEAIFGDPDPRDPSSLLNICLDIAEGNMLTSIEMGVLPPTVMRATRGGVRTALATAALTGLALGATVERRRAAAALSTLMDVK